MGDLAAMVQAGLAATAPQPESNKELAARAKAREREADEIVVETRSLVGRIPDAAAFRELAEAADDAADALEEAVFLLTLLPSASSASLPALDALRPLSALAIASAGAYAACVECARAVRRGTASGASSEMRAFLDAVDRVIMTERDADDAERHATAALVGAEGIDPRALLVLNDLTHELEACTDALLHASLILRDHLLGTVMVERG